MSQPTRRTVLRTAAAGGALLGSTGIAVAHGNGNGRGNDTADANSDLAQVRKATAKYQKVENAEADGYVTDGHCVRGPPELGNMGVHYVNFLDQNGDPTGLDATVDPEEPEALVYEPHNGNLNLVAVEWLATEDFELFGQHPHEGPLPGSFALHAWVWKGNPNGVFANFNPNVRCPPVEEPE